MIHKKTIKTILYFVFLCYINFSLSGQEYISFSHSPGFYNEDINLVLSTVDPAIEIYYCFDLRDHMYLWYETHPDYGFYPGNKTMGPWVSFSDSIGLTAVNGEQAFYNLKVRAYKNHKMLEELDITYSIDKKRPFPPILNTPQGEYQENITLSFINKEDSNERVKIFYSINSIVLETGSVWNERSFVLKGEYGKKK